MWPFNDNIFSEEDFIASNLTEEEPPETTWTTIKNLSAPPLAPARPQPGASSESEVELNAPPPQTPQPGTSRDNNAREILEKMCSPPKPKQKRERKRKAEKANVITSSPYKTQVIEKKLPSYNKKVKKHATKKKPPSPTSSDEAEWPCLVCGEPFANSRPSEKWIQCRGCKNWSHAECTTGVGLDLYVCQNCEFD